MNEKREWSGIQGDELDVFPTKLSFIDLVLGCPLFIVVLMSVLSHLDHSEISESSSITNNTINKDFSTHFFSIKEV